MHKTYYGEVYIIYHNLRFHFSKVWCMELYIVLFIPHSIAPVVRTKAGWAWMLHGSMYLYTYISLFCAYSLQYIPIFSCDQAALRTLLSVPPSTVTKFQDDMMTATLSKDNVAVIISSWNFQELLPLADMMSMLKVKVKGQGHRGQDPT